MTRDTTVGDHPRHNSLPNSDRPAEQDDRAVHPPAVVAVDLPSGIGPDDGSVHPPVLPADVTVTFGAIKAGLLLPPASALVGRIRLVDIGLGPVLAHVRPLVRRPASERAGTVQQSSPG